MPAVPPFAEVAQALDLAADAAGVSRALVRAVAWTESRWTPTARGKAGERGIMQLMPRTAAGSVADVPVDLLDDVAANAAGGARLLRYLLRKFKGNESAALAAYNWGEGRVGRNLDPASWPPQVVRYVERVQARKLANAPTASAYLAQHRAADVNARQGDDGAATASARPARPARPPRAPRVDGRSSLPLSSSPRASRQSSAKVAGCGLVDCEPSGCAGSSDNAT